jgi:hypothetical protein
MGKDKRRHADRQKAVNPTDAFVKKAAPVLELAMKQTFWGEAKANSPTEHVRSMDLVGDRLFDRWFEVERNRRTNAIFALLCEMIELV